MKRPKLVLPILLSIAMSTSASEEKDFPVSTPDGTITAKQKTVDSTEQKFEPLSVDRLQRVAEWGREAHGFVRTYLGDGSPVTLKTCDEAFSAWQREQEKQFDSSEVISYLGAFLGQRCVAELEMEWVMVSDEYGQDYAVRYTKGEVLGYPLSSVAKRIEKNTHIFMVPVFYAIKQKIDNGDYRK